MENVSFGGASVRKPLLCQHLPEHHGCVMLVDDASGLPAEETAVILMAVSTFSRTLHMMYKQISAPISGCVANMERSPLTGGSFLPHANRNLALNVSFLLCSEVNIPLLVLPSSKPSGCASPQMTIVIAACDWSRVVVIRVSARSPERLQWTD